MKAGRELDALVAEKVMGWPLVDYTDQNSERYKAFRMIEPGGHSVHMAHYQLPRFSEDVAAAWTVVEKLGDRFILYMSTRGRMTEVNLQHWPDNLKGYYSAHAETAALAICKAALKAVGVTNVG